MQLQLYDWNILRTNGMKWNRIDSWSFLLTDARDVGGC